jgi:hypothetical protein
MEGNGLASRVILWNRTA